ncbi:MAG TPA: glycosyltransferase [Planctomycetota bacterium]|jgi:rhamnosyltransferase
MRISVVIPTFNAGDDLAALLERLRAQKPAPPDEIIVIDSGSKDATCSVAEKAGAKVIRWDKPFNHGLTRDAGIRAASGDIVFLTVQDALPASDDFLARISAHFHDPSVAGVSGRQLPPEDGPLELQIKAQLDAQNEQPARVSLQDHQGYANDSPAQRLELYRFDNVCSALRRSVWETIPFGECRYAEDLLWARRVLEAGHTVVRDPGAAVVHAHRRRFFYELRRGLLDAWVLDEQFGYRYRTREKLDRARAIASPRAKKAGMSARLGAIKTYAAHALARWFYTACRLMLPSRSRRRLLESLTRGI